MKGLVLAGGAGTRLHPLTLAVSKQLLPVYDKPMIYYPLSTLMLTGIREILLISTPEDLPRYRACLGDGASVGISLSYAVQPRPDGIASALVIGADFIGADPVALVLGDNLFFGEAFIPILMRMPLREPGALVFGCRVPDPERYAVVTLDAAGRPTSLEEKPAEGGAGYAVPGLYFYDNDVLEIARSLKPSARGELEITDVNLAFMRQGHLHVAALPDDVTWFDAGTYDSLLDASNFVRQAEVGKGSMIGSIHEVALRMGYIDRIALSRAAAPLRSSPYGQRLLRLAANGAGP